MLGRKELGQIRKYILAMWNNHNPTSYYKLCVPVGDSIPVGFVLRKNLPTLQEWPGIFTIYHDTREIQLHLKLDTFEKRSKKIQEFTRKLLQQKVLQRWRNENYPSNLTRQPFFEIERTASVFFGIHQYGTHLTAFTMKKNDISEIWLGKRAPNKYPFPNRYDTIAGGGLPIGVEPLDNMMKEAQEEAGMTTSELQDCRAVGHLTYKNDITDGLMHNTMLLYDVVCPETFEPRNGDGEVMEFALVPKEEILQMMLYDPEKLKPDALLMLTHFFLRHGVIYPKGIDCLKPYLQLCDAVNGIDYPHYA